MSKATNSQAGRQDKLEPVPNRDGEMPPENLLPETISQLLVGGAEHRVDSPRGVRAGWSKTKSLAMLKFYKEDLGTVSDGEGESDDHSRNRRLQCARAIGVTQVQLNFAQLTL